MTLDAKALAQLLAHGDDPEQLLRLLSDEQLRTGILIVSMSFKEFRDEAVRRGIWDDIKKTKVV